MKLLKNVAYEATDLVGEVIKITNNHMDFYRPAPNCSPLLIMKSSVKAFNYGDLCPFALKVGTKWMIWESKADEVLIANFRKPEHQFWIPLNELQRSARLIA